MLFSKEFALEIEGICRRIINEHLNQPKAKAKEYLSIKEAAEFLDCTPQHLYNLRSQGVIRFRKSGKRSHVKTAELITYLERKAK